MWLLAQIEPVLIANGFRRETDSRMRFSKVQHPLSVSIEEHRYRGWQKERGTTVKFLVSLFNPIQDGPLPWPVVTTAWFQGDHVAWNSDATANLITTPANRPHLASQFIDVGLKCLRDSLSIDVVRKQIDLRIEQRHQLVKHYRRPLKRFLLFGQAPPREAPYDQFCASLAAWHSGDLKQALAHAENYRTAINDTDSQQWLQFLQRNTNEK